MFCLLVDYIYIYLLFKKAALVGMCALTGSMDILVCIVGHVGLGISVTPDLTGIHPD